MVDVNLSQFLTQNCLKIMEEVLGESISTLYSLHHAKGKLYTANVYSQSADKLISFLLILQLRENL